MCGQFKSAAGKTWREKLERSKGKVVPMPPKMANRLGNGTLLVPKGTDVEAAIRRIRSGELVTQALLREHLARAAGADIACPITTGIFVRIAAEAAAEEERAGKQRVTPYWRVIGNDGSLLEKLPGGANEQAARLALEGQRIVRGKKPRIADFADHLARLT
jgi:alkylated DNA nucleotide flippase Atl1